MIIVTWNINSIRIRLENLAKLVKESNADIICLQETKVTDDLFPIDFIKNLGYPYLVFHGEKSYNGVAILSKIPFNTINNYKFAGRDSCRHLSVLLNNDIELHNFYIPAGGDETDTSLNPNFAYKLEYLDQITDWFSKERKDNQKIILLGDLNIAPLEHDVWSHKQLLKVISHTPIEIEKMGKLLKTIDWCDVSRHFVPASEKLYSWWSYRNRDWRKSNRGRRLDHIWVTQPLKPLLVKSWIMQEARSWVSPSDHVPVIAELDI